VGGPLPENGAGKGFFLFLHQSMEEFTFISVFGNDTFFAIHERYPEFIRTDLLLRGDDLLYGAATVIAALAYKGHCESSLSVG
jgi:hypothetical protein